MFFTDYNGSRIYKLENWKENFVVHIAEQHLSKLPGRFIPVDVRHVTFFHANMWVCWVWYLTPFAWLGYWLKGWYHMGFHIHWHGFHHWEKGIGAFMQCRCGHYKLTDNFKL